jgi:hypothetical protein
VRRPSRRPDFVVCGWLTELSLCEACPCHDNEMPRPAPAIIRPGDQRTLPKEGMPRDASAAGVASGARSAFGDLHVKFEVPHFPKSHGGTDGSAGNGADGASAAEAEKAQELRAQRADSLLLAVWEGRAAELALMLREKPASIQVGICPRVRRGHSRVPEPPGQRASAPPACRALE